MDHGHVASPPSEDSYFARAALLCALEVFRDELSGERRAVGFRFWRDAVGASADGATLASRQGVKISGEEASAGHAHFDCFTSAVGCA
jgi:hypothetical protein